MAARKDKQVTMRLVYIDFWSSLKLSFLVAIVVAALTMLISFLGWTVLDKTGLVDTVSTLLTDIAGSKGSALVSGLTFSSVMTFALVIALLQLIVVTALGAIFAALFNLASRVTGGAKVRFGNK
ncbi:DUF3566 domain-containing protein [Leifsonia poae]|uniref:DUF3566 domain-containing protein n=1 Tax=Leifsonia poae TaxID=110933 RepID=UPI001CC0AA5A|nr:DUF3566 domain-containing protein [Leifsonia poae]